jgi:hypothetical protein
MGQQALKCSEGHLLAVANFKAVLGDQDVESETNERLVQQRRRTPS